jgi:5-methylcytosine-specific restriction endonuclease McrA
MIIDWKPSTYGEELFLNLHAELGAPMRIAGPAGSDMDFLVNQDAFRTFTALSVTSEVFLRCVRVSANLYRQASSAPAIRFAQEARRELDLPLRLLQNQSFAERLKHVGRIVVERHRDKTIEANATRDEPNRCYLCGVELTRQGDSKRTVEHVWPLSLGGETVEQNLVLACHDCNSKRGHMMTWAHGPVHSTYYTRSSNRPANPPGDLRLSLGLARLLQAAAPTRTRKAPLTLKGAIHVVRPAIPALAVADDRPYVYFELLEKVGEPA